MAFPTTFVTIQNSVIASARLDATADLAKVKDWINKAYATACVETEFYENSSTSTALAANASSVAVPTALIKVDYIVPSGSDGSRWGTMELVDFEEILDNRASSGGAVMTTGAPTLYAFRSGSTASIEFWPNASGGETLTFYGSQLPTALSADADLTIFPEPYPEVVEYGALWKAAQFKKDLFFLDKYQGFYMEWINRLRAFQNTRAGDKTMQFKVAHQIQYPRGNSVDTGR